MFSVSLRKVVSQTNEAASLPVLERANLELSQTVAETEKHDFSCLNDVFGEMLSEQPEYALSKW